MCKRDMRDPRVPPISGFTGSQKLRQGNSSSMARAAALDIFVLASSISRASSCRKPPASLRSDPARLVRAVPGSCVHMALEGPASPHMPSLSPRGH